MSDCNLRMDAFLDGELGPQEHRAVEDHLAACPACRAQAESARRDCEQLRRVLGGLLLHVGLVSQVAQSLPQRRQSMVMAQTRGVRRQWALAGFGMALAFVIFSLVRTGPSSVMTLLTDAQRAGLLLDWAMMLFAGSILVWPEIAAGLERRALAMARAKSPKAGHNERALIQGLGLGCLLLATTVHFLVMRHLGF